MEDTTIDFTEITSFTKEEFENLKVKHGRAYVVTVEDEGKTLHFAAVRPTRSIISAIGDAAAKQDIAKVNDLLVKNLLKLGNLEALEDGTTYLTVVSELGKMLEPAKSFLQKG